MGFMKRNRSSFRRIFWRAVPDGCTTGWTQHNLIIYSSNAVRSVAADDLKCVLALNRGLMTSCIRYHKNLRHFDFRHKLRGEPPWCNSQCQKIWSSSGDPSTQFDELRSLCEAKELDMGVDILSSMEQQGSGPPFKMYGLLLKACAKRRALGQARRVCAHMMKYGVESIRLLGESMVSTLVKCGGLEDAVHIFNRLPDRTAYSWTTLISGYTASGQGQEALRTYQQMQEEGVEPNAYAFISLIKACSIIADLEQGKRIHAEALRYRCEADLFVRTCLVDMYAKCGSILDAEILFDVSSEPDVVSWTVMLAAYVHHGQAEKTLQLYDHMRAEGISPNDRTYVTTLQACSMLADKEQEGLVHGQSTRVQSLGIGRAIHAEARGKGYNSNAFVGSTLVGMYQKCGSLMDAQIVFDELAHRDVVSWTVMIAAYVEQGQAETALHLYEQMREAGVSPDACTFVSTLQACSMLLERGEDIVDGKFTNLKSLERGKAVHAEAERNGYGSNVFVCNTLVDLYGKCGSILEARALFDMLSHRDVVSWNAMLGSYIQQGLGEEALELYTEMQEAGVTPVVRTFVSVLQACGIVAEKEHHIVVAGQSTKSKSLQTGKAMHAEVQRKGYDSDVFVGSTLVGMYAKCGSIMDAWNAFDELSECNVVAWVALLAAYVEQREAEKVLQLYDQMLHDGISPDSWSYVTTLQACSILADKEERVVINGLATKFSSLQKTKLLHAIASTKCYDSHIFVSNTLISMYAKCGSFLDAQNSFDRLHHEDVISWNVLLTSYVEQGQGEQVMELYRRMQEKGVSPDGWTFVSVLRGCSMLAENEGDSVLNGKCTKVNTIEKGKAIHANAWMKQHDGDVFIGSILVNMYGKCGSIVDARSVFDGLPHQDVVSWNVMLAVYVDHGLADETFQLYEEMWEEGIIPDEITHVYILHACSDTGNLAMARQIHHHLVSSTINLSHVLVNTLISTYGRCAAMADAQAMFNGMHQPSEVSWNALLAGYTRQGNWSQSLQVYKEMQLSGVEPNGVTFLSLLSACSHAGLVEKGVEYFESMSRDHQILPQIEHFVCIIDLLGRAGDFLRIEELLSTMPMQPDLSVWLCLLGACRKHGQVEMGKRAFDCLVRLQPKHSAAYLLMWNIFADAGLWDRATEVNDLRQKAGAWERPAQSWMEHEHAFSSFVVEDRKHRQREQVYHLLGKVKLDGACSVDYCLHSDITRREESATL